MKKLFLILTVLSASLTASADGSYARRPMLVQGKAWFYTYHNGDDVEKSDEITYPVGYQLQGDTVIDGRNYMKMYRHTPDSHKYYGAFREDEGGKVWQYDRLGDKQDFMVCDVTCSSYPGPEYMASDHLIRVNGQLLHRYTWEDLVGVEGVGLERYGLVHYPYGDAPDWARDHEKFIMVVNGGGASITAAIFRVPNYIDLTQEEKTLVEKNNDFAFRLFRKARGEESTIMSPLSITYALGMLNNGAAGQTQQEISNVLGFDDVDAQNDFCQKMMRELAMARNMDTSKALISNTIFVNQGQGWQLQDDFEKKALKYYQATPDARDFADGKTRDVINQWASDHTEGMIKEVLTEPEFSPLAVSYLLNAIYFKGLWTLPFNEADTREEPFAGGEPVPMMHNKTDLPYTEDELCQSVTLPYGNGTYQMQVFLPREGKALGELAESLNGKNWKMNGEMYEVDLKLPRFETVSSIKLRQVMAELGMPSAFDPQEADFSKLCVNDLGENIFISDMKQVAKIEVNEKGTEAAAVTITEMVPTSMPDVATFHANRPFLYTISEQSTGVILFIGQYMGNGVTNAIEPVSLAADKPQQHIYGITGQRLSTPPAHGLSIRNGRKYVK